MNEKVVETLSEHINFELYSGYIYLELALIMEKQNYKGYSTWLMRHYEEELAHAKDFIEFMFKRGATPMLKDIKMEKFSVKEPIEVAKIALEHEQKVTKLIYKIHDIAKKTDDYATEIFMHKYINEQIEEENMTREIVDSFTLAGENIAAKMSVDRDLRG